MWEYKTEKIDKGAIDYMFRQLGKEGWELVSVVIIPGDINPTHYFKRKTKG